MFLTDFHMHSKISPDGHSSMYEMACASAAAGVQILCFTDHCDMVDWVRHKPTDEGLEMMPLLMDHYRQMLEQSPPVDVRLGIELGEAQLNPEPVEEITSYPLDFVLGSLHILRGYGDVYFIEYESLDHCRHMMDTYLDNLLEVAQMDFFDVMAHIGYPKRNMRSRGFDYALTVENGGDKLREILETLISNGRGIEVNCSGIRDGCGPFPDLDILKLFRELGGEIVTLGSDAHRPEDAAKGLREGMELIQAAGFRYVTTFKKREPEFISLDL
jgi:histidinol-phosphatase (PHP family)